MPKAHEPTVNKACQPCRAAKVACKRGSVDSVCQRCEAQGLECVSAQRKDRVVTATLAQWQQERQRLNDAIAVLNAKYEETKRERDQALDLLRRCGIDQSSWSHAEANVQSSDGERRSMFEIDTMSSTSPVQRQTHLVSLIRLYNLPKGVLV
ncbi:hypothetical protein EXIGLDRAFT_441824 [Exidia glandulosa HHB12029]|uniref:Zn(2)-C6 fungal-type domain-containing protein n=1 Tax=Exidia glandulosa HHB12029 TaxID=1314781 RepID=A0A165KB83_EXIGL|nr:hypothetical protein EXIGLDRAFT_441824 [Exidia glandulosa HHB12029]